MFSASGPHIKVSFILIFTKNWFWSPFHVKVMDSGICIQNTECGYARWVIHAPEHELLARECFELRDMQQ